MVLRFKFLATLVAILTLGSPALAGQTPWVEVGPGSRIRLISSDTIIDGTTMAAIEIDMPATTKTYWRIPGETGIPLLLDAKASIGVSTAQILWPYPQRESAGGFIDFVYHGPTVLPVRLKVSDDIATFDTRLILGICDEICVPVRTNLSLDMALGTPDLSQSLRIKQAMAEVPVLWETAPPPIGDVSVDLALARVNISFVPETVDPRSIIIDTGNTAHLFSLPKKGPDFGAMYFELLDAAEIGAIDGAQMTFTFATPDGTFELTRTVRAVANSQGNS